jgi:hypothetical protein
MFKYGQLILFLSDDEHFDGAQACAGVCGVRVQGGRRDGQGLQAAMPQRRQGCPGLDEQK